MRNEGITKQLLKTPLSQNIRFFYLYALGGK